MEISATNTVLTPAFMDARPMGRGTGLVEGDSELTRGQGRKGLERMSKFTVSQGRESLAGLRSSSPGCSDRQGSDMQGQPLNCSAHTLRRVQS